LLGLQGVLNGVIVPEIVLLFEKEHVVPGEIDSAVEQASPVAADVTKETMKQMKVIIDFNQLNFIAYNYLKTYLIEKRNDNIPCNI
jgi:hypothetical protein